MPKDCKNKYDLKILHTHTHTYTYITYIHTYIHTYRLLFVDFKIAKIPEHDEVKANSIVER